MFDVNNIKNVVTGIGKNGYIDLDKEKIIKEGIGRIWIRPGSLAYTDVFLDSSLVTVEWEVREITIEDRYEIILNPIFNTSVTEVARIVVSLTSSIG